MPRKPDLPLEGPPQRPAALTLDDVARRAGVSSMTVSNVINDKPGVRATTRQRVLDAIRDTGYRVNPLARALAGGRSRMISVLTPQMNRPYATEVVEGAGRAAEALRYDLVVMMLIDSRASDLSVMTRLSSGALLIQPDHELAGRGDLPAHVISIDGPGPRRLSVDNYGGARQAVRHLMDLGHTRIGCISGLLAEADQPATGPGGRDDAAERLRGYRDGLAEGQLATPEAWVAHGDFSAESGRRAARAILQASPSPTALFVSGDAMAVGAVQAARDLGLAVPADLSVVGFDDLPLAAAAHPSLTTVRQPLQQLGEVAVHLLVELAEGRAGPQPPPFPTQLVQRDSTAPPTAERG